MQALAGRGLANKPLCSLFCFYFYSIKMKADEIGTDSPNAHSSEVWARAVRSPGSHHQWQGLQNLNHHPPLGCALTGSCKQQQDQELNQVLQYRRQPSQQLTWLLHQTPSPYIPSFRFISSVSHFYTVLFLSSSFNCSSTTETQLFILI